MPKNMDRVFIKDLIIEMSVGIYDHEKKNKQRVIINIVLEVESNKGKNIPSIDEVVSYEQITNNVNALAQKDHYDLLEEFAEYIAEMCLKNTYVLSTHIKIEKPDIIKQAASVGIEVFRS